MGATDPCAGRCGVDCAGSGFDGGARACVGDAAAAGVRAARSGGVSRDACGGDRRDGGRGGDAGRVGVGGRRRVGRCFLRIVVDLRPYLSQRDCYLPCCGRGWTASARRAGCTGTRGRTAWSWKRARCAAASRASGSISRVRLCAGWMRRRRCVRTAVRMRSWGRLRGFRLCLGCYGGLMSGGFWLGDK